MKTFELKGKKVIFYGAASIGTIMLPQFRNAGFDVIGFIDKRAKEMPSFMHRPVYSIDDRALDSMLSDDFVVIISVKNVFEHSNIANALINRGFHQIIFRPNASLEGYGNELQNKLNDAYSLVENEKYDEAKGIPCSEVKEPFVPRDSAIIDGDNDQVVAYLPIDMLFSDNKKRETSWFNKPVMAMLPHIDLFRFISGDTHYTVDRYMQFCIDSAKNSDWIEITDAWKQNVVKNRAQIYEHMMNSMDLEPNFFIRNAPKCTYDQRRCLFNLNSGKHRAALFVSLKRKFIPLKIEKASYEQYLKKDLIESLSKELNEEYPDVLPAPVPHPYFYSYPCESKEFYYNFLYFLSYHIADDLYNKTHRIDFNDVSIRFALNDLGFMERVAWRWGCSISISNEHNSNCLKILDKLFSTDIVGCMNNTEEIVDYNIIDFSNAENVTEEVQFACCKSKEVLIIIRNNQLEDIDKEAIDLQVYFNSIMNGICYLVASVKTQKERL